MVFFGKLLSIKAVPRLNHSHLVAKMRCRWLYLVFVILLLDLLVNSEAQRTRNRRRNTNSNGNQVQPRIVDNSATGNRNTGTNRLQTRIVGANSRPNSRRNRNRRLRRRTNRNRSRSSRSSSSSTTGGVSPRIVDNSATSRINGGSSTSISSMPYMLQVHRGASSLCGGTLIAPRWCMSAAHCVVGYRASAFYVVGGTQRQNGTDGVYRRVILIIIGNRFTSRRMNMDISLLKMNATMTGTNIAVIPLATSRPRRGASLLIAGWGATSENGDTVNLLRSTRVPVVGQKRCRRDFINEAIITRLMLCAGVQGKDTCSGDSGGPAVYNGEVVGITSFGVGCGRRNSPGVYTNVAILRPWILQRIQNN